MKKSKRSKKAITFLFTTMAQACSAVVQCVKHQSEAENGLQCAIEARTAAKADLVYTVKQAHVAGFKIEKRASKGTFALELQTGLKAAGYADKTISNTLNKLRDMQGGVNTGKRGKKSKTVSGPISGFSMNIGTAAKPEIVKNKVVALAEYLKAEYPANESMLRIAAYLIDVSDEA